MLTCNSFSRTDAHLTPGARVGVGGANIGRVTCVLRGRTPIDGARTREYSNKHIILAVCCILEVWSNKWRWRRYVAQFGAQHMWVSQSPLPDAQPLRVTIRTVLTILRI